MTSTNDRRRARELAATRGIKYTAALREIQATKAPTQATPMPLTFGHGHLGDTTSPLTLDLSLNLLVGGDPASGATTLLRSLATHGIGAGWRVVILRADKDYPRHLPVPGTEDHIIWPTPSGVSGEAVLAQAVNALAPGSADRPLLLILDDTFDALRSHSSGDPFMLESPWPGVQGWGTKVVDLMRAPHTGVALRAPHLSVPEGSGWERGPLWSLPENRVHLGPVRHEARFLEVVGDDVAARALLGRGRGARLTRARGAAAVRTPGGVRWAVPVVAEGRPRGGAFLGCADG